MRLVGQYGLVLVCAIVVMAWGTSPCLYADIVANLADGGAGCCCDCCCDQDGQRRGDDCPACKNQGNMHELPPVGDPVALDPPTVDFAPDAPPPAAGGQAPAVGLAPPGAAPPLAQYRDTVSLAR